MKSLIKIAILALLLILGYNYFLGNDQEKEQAEKIVDKVKALGSEIKTLVVSEKNKFDEGKYDNTINKFTELIASVKEKISNIDYDNLESKKTELEKSIQKLKEKGQELNQEDTSKLENEMESLFKELEQVIEKIDKK